MNNITSETFPSGQNQKRHFYISHVSEDTNMAAWIAWTLEAEGYQTTVPKQDLRYGSNVVEWRNDVLSKADRVMVLLSPSYLKAISPAEAKESRLNTDSEDIEVESARYLRSEWTSAFSKENLLPVLVKRCDIDSLGFFRTLAYINLVDIDEAEAQRRLLEGVKLGRVKPPNRPIFPVSDAEDGEPVLVKQRQPIFPGDEDPITSKQEQDPFISPRTRISKRAVKEVFRSIRGRPLEISHPVIQSREKLVKKVYSDLMDRNTTAIALTGIAGVGKSTLASLIRRCAEDERTRGSSPFAAEAFWLEFDKDVRTLDLAGTLFAAFGKSLEDFRTLPPHQQAEQLFEILENPDRPMLVILDGFETLLNVKTGALSLLLPEQLGINEWLKMLGSRRSACKMLFASTSLPLSNILFYKGHSIDHGLTDHGLPGSEEDEEDEGVHLLEELPVDGTEAERREAVKRCKGHPFALHLLKVLLPYLNMTLGELLNDPNYSTLWYGEVARNILDHIYDQLTAEQKKLLSAFFIYRKPVPLAAAWTIVSPELNDTDINSAFYGLLAQHLLQAMGRGTYELHTIVTVCARRVFDKDKQAEQDALGRAAGYYLRLFLKGGEVAHLQEVMWYYSQAEQWQEIYNVLQDERVYSPFIHSKNHKFLLDQYQSLFPLSKWRPSALDEASFYSTMGDLYYDLGQKTDAQKSYIDGLVISRQGKERGWEAEMLNKLGRVYEDMGDKGEAEANYNEALKIFREIRYRLGEGKALNNLGRLYKLLERKDEARRYLDAALPIADEVQNHALKGWIQNLRGEVLSGLGEKPLAQGCFEEALEIFRNPLSKDREGEASVLNNLGILYKTLGRTQEAVQNYEEARKIFVEEGDDEGQAEVLNNLGVLYNGRDVQRRDEALADIQQALKIYETMGNRRGQGVAMSNLGAIYSARGEKEQAKKQYEKALSIHQEVGNRHGEGITRNDLGVLSHDSGQIQDALQYYKQALDILIDIKDYWEEGRTLNNIGTLYFRLKQPRYYNVALASFLLADELCGQVQSPDRDITQQRLDALRDKIGQPEYDRLSKKVRGKENRIIADALRQEI